MKKIFQLNFNKFIEKTTHEIHSKINLYDCDLILNDMNSCIKTITTQFKVEKITIKIDEITYTKKIENVWDNESNPDTWIIYKFKVPYQGDDNLLNYYSNNGMGTITPYFIKNKYIIFESVNFDLNNPLKRNNKIEILKDMIFNLNKEYENWNKKLIQIVKSYFKYREYHLIELKKFCKKYGITKGEIKKMKFKLSALEALSKIIADNNTGSEITTLFKKAGFPEIVHDGNTKWKFLCETFENMQEESIEGFYKILKVLEVVCDPQEYILNPENHREVLETINKVLSFYGFKFNENGTLKSLNFVNTQIKTTPEQYTHNEEHFDVFISYASNDKEMVDELYECLSNTNLKIWYDTGMIKIGDNIREKINDGLTKSDYGIVILSKDFINRSWPKREFEALIPLIEDDKLLPINHGLSNEELDNFFKPLTVIHYLSTRQYSIKEICKEILSKIKENEILNKNNEHNEKFE